jgi:hypothetical protein
VAAGGMNSRKMHKMVTATPKKAPAMRACEQRTRSSIVQKHCVEEAQDESDEQQQQQDEMHAPIRHHSMRLLRARIDPFCHHSSTCIESGRHPSRRSIAKKCAPMIKLCREQPNKQSSLFRNLDAACTLALSFVLLGTLAFHILFKHAPKVRCYACACGALCLRVVHKVCFWCST